MVVGAVVYPPSILHCIHSSFGDRRVTWRTAFFYHAREYLPSLTTTYHFTNTITDSDRKVTKNTNFLEDSTLVDFLSNMSRSRAVDAAITKPVNDFVWRQDCGYGMIDYYAAEMTSCTVGPIPAKLFLSDLLPYNHEFRAASSVLVDEHRESQYSLVRHSAHRESDKIRNLVSSITVSYISNSTNKPEVWWAKHSATGRYSSSSANLYGCRCRQANGRCESR